MSRIINIVARGKSATGGDWTDVEGESSVSPGQFPPYEAAPEPSPRSQLGIAQLIERRVVSLDESSAAGRELRRLRTQLLQTMRDQQLRVLGISSPAEGSGRAFFATNIAAAMAAEGQQRVTLVDMDLRSPKVHHYFAMEPSIGVREVLERRASPLTTLQSTALEQLRVLPSSNAVSAEPERFFARELGELLPALLEPDNNQIIVVRLPPVLESAETQAYMPAMDCSICVLKEGINTPQQVEETLAVLKQKAFMGVIFNRSVKFKR